MPPNENASARLLKFLDNAYEVPFNHEAFDDLFHSAQKFFYRDTTSGLIADDITGHDGPSLQSHVTRIQKLLDQQDDALQGEKLPPSHQAQLLISGDGAVVLGNTTAANMLGIQFPAPLSKIPFDGQTQARLRDIIKKLDNRELHTQAFLSLGVEHLDKHFPAQCYFLDAKDKENIIGGSALAISIVDHDWSARDIDFACELFDLTSSELDVLKGLLNGLSQSEIAERRQRSLETIRAQAKSILRKSGRRNMTDLIQLVTALTHMSEARKTSTCAPVITDYTSGGAQSISGTDGRRLSYYQYGALKGKPILFVSGLLHGPFLSPTHNKLFADAGYTVYALSRPGFGETEAPSSPDSYIEVSARDARDLIDYIGGDVWSILALHTGANHGFRTANLIGSRIKSIALVSAGIPIDPQRHLAKMSLQTQVTAAASKHAPLLMEMIVRIGISNFKRKGPRAYLQHYYEHSPLDLALLNEPEAFEVIQRGASHMVSQGVMPFIWESTATMADWTALFDQVQIPQIWIHGDSETVVKLEFVKEFVAEKLGQSVHAMPGGTANILHTHAQDVIQLITSHFEQSHPHC